MQFQLTSLSQLKEVELHLDAIGMVFKCVPI